MVSLLSLIKCSVEDPLPREYPRIQSLEISNISESGAVFEASISNAENHQIDEYGFIWDNTQQNPTVDSSDKRILKGNINSGKFSAKISTTLNKDETYYVRAYAKSNDFLVYSKILNFLSLGSEAPILSDFFPKEGVWNDTISIKGSNFSYKEENNEVKFNNYDAEVVESNDSIIKCLVPPGMGAITSKISVKIADHTITSNSNFSIIPPTINSITPLNGTFGDELIITGENFGTKEEFNQVYFGEVLGIVSASSKNALKVLVPNDLQNSSESISIVSNLQRVDYSNNFTLTPPSITAVTPEIYIDQEMVIEGTNFHPEAVKNIVTIAGNTAEIISNDRKRIIARVPKGPYINREVEVKVQITDLAISYDTDVNILDNWILVNDELPFRYYGSINNAVVANGNAYLITLSRDIFDESFYLWKFDQTNMTWQQKSIPIAIDQFDSGGVVETDGTNIYVYLPYTNNTFWQYNTITESWSRKSDFIGIPRSNATHFNIDGIIYMGLGTDFSPYDRIRHIDFYKYNPQNDQWTRVSDATGVVNRGPTASFVIDGIGYFTGGGHSTGAVDSWSYNPSSDSWTQIADNPYALQSGNAGFAIDGIGYVTASGYTQRETWQYDPVTNLWTEGADSKVGRIDNFSFVLNGRGYIGAGGIYGGGSTGYDMFEFKP